MAGPGAWGSGGRLPQRAGGLGWDREWFVVGEGTPPPGHQTSWRQLVLLWEQRSLGKAVPGLAPSKRSWFSSLAGIHGGACHDWGASRTPAATPKPGGRREPRRRPGTRLLAGWGSGSVLTSQSLSPSPARWCPQPGTSRSITGWGGQRPGPGTTGQVRGGTALVAPWLPAPAGLGAATFCSGSREPG